MLQSNYASVEDAPLRGEKITILSVITLFSLIFCSQAVFADENLSISISPDSALLSLMPGDSGSATQTITASTTNKSGYTIGLQTTGESSALTHTEDNSFSIPTLVLPDGASSIPSSSLENSYGYSLDGGLNYLPIPNPTIAATTIFETSVSGTNTHTLTFGVDTPNDIAAGSYANSFIISIVANPLICPANNICYYSNGGDGVGTMENQSANSNTEVTLIPSNYSYPGYGFAGWNTEPDGSGTDYGPSQSITTGDISSFGLRLFAKWVPSSGNLQNWKGCSSLSEGTVIALTDTRDGNAYAVTKYGDNKCWMMENFRLDLSDQNLEINSLNTNNPTTSFANTINQTHPASSNSFCSGYVASCTDRILHNTNNTNRNLTATYNTNNNSSSWYAYGNYYNWYTATAGNGTYSLSAAGAAAEGDICPAGWRLPSGSGSAGDLAMLDIAMGGTGGNASGSAASKRWRAYPYNFVYSGEQKGEAANNRNNSSSYVTTNTATDINNMNLWLKKDGVNMNSNGTPKVRGQTIRCVINNAYSEIGNIHYDANGGTGTMADATNVNLGAAVAANNEFAKSYSTFIGWNTSADGTGIVVVEGGSVATAASHMGIVEGGTLTLYAIWQSQYSLSYDDNGADAGSMSSVRVRNLEVGQMSLSSSNFSRAGYGFAGWSVDSTAATKLINGNSVQIYGPNERITVDSNFLANADPNTGQITLYAVWLPEDSTYTMQTFGASECGALNVGDVLALKDIRDNNVYMVAKLGDNHCWMAENLRLIPSATTLSNANTNLPTASFATAAASSASADILCNSDDSTCVDQIGFNSNTINRSYSPSHSSNRVDSSWYSYGVMYNWYTATAGNGVFNMSSGNVVGDICPAGWRLPTGGASSSEYVSLNNVINNGSTATSDGLVRFPANFIYSGDYNYDTPGGRNTYGRYWSATPKDTYSAYRFGTTSYAGPTPAGSWKKWDAFAVRCIVK